MLYISINQFCFGQFQSMGFVQRCINPREDVTSEHVYRPRLKVLNDTLYVCTNNGIYIKNLVEDSEWELYAFENIPITEFVKNGNKLLAISTGTSDRTDSLLLLSNDNGQTFINFTSPHFLQYGSNYLHRIVQNPENNNSILVLHSAYGVSKSDDFGLSWTNLNQNNFGAQNWYLSFYPFDTTTIYYAGETMYFAGIIVKSSNSGDTWSNYIHPGGDNCVHSIAFHPTNPDILVYSGEGTIAKSTDKGETWDVIDVIGLYNTGMYFYKILFDEENPAILYSSGRNGKYVSQDSIWIYRSTDMGSSWELAYKEKMNEDCKGVYDMVKYKDVLILYTWNSGLFKLHLENTGVPNARIENQPLLTIFPNPIQDILRFETDIEINTVEIVDLTGRILQKTSISNNERKIDISRLNSGMYIAVFYANGLNIKKKICVVK